MNDNQNIRTTEDNYALIRDKVRGCLIGGAAGDALGYAIEFWRESEIFETYGEKGLQAYVLDRVTGKAIVSDDTQMTMFTANGILSGITKAKHDRCDTAVFYTIANAYQDWLITQQLTQPKKGSKPASWIGMDARMYDRRAPGNTCLSALYEQQNSDVFADIDSPLNHSKGCGGVMRAAPMGLRRFTESDLDTIDYYGAQIAANTHGHSLGYLPAAVMTHVIHRIVYPENSISLKEIVVEAIDTVARIFAEDININTLTALLKLAVELSENTDPDLSNIHRLGEGWGGEEALAIAIYCALRYQNDFSSCIIAAANHNGDSDSTAAVAGNILGAWVGFSALDEKWKTDLELFDLLLELADDLSRPLPLSDDGNIFDEAWLKKYAAI